MKRILKITLLIFVIVLSSIDIVKAGILDDILTFFGISVEDEFELLDYSDNLIGFEELNNGTVWHIWNPDDDYYFNTSSGIQFTNHYNEYWAHNIFCGGYKNNTGDWIYNCNDKLPFNWEYETDNQTYVNITGYRNKTISNRKVRIGLQYFLGINDTKLTIKPTIENIGEYNITQDTGFAWRINRIQIANDTENDWIRINDTEYRLNNSLDLSFRDMTRFRGNDTVNWTEPLSHYKIYDKEKAKYLTLDWNPNLNYKVIINSTQQYNSPVTLGINVGPLNVGDMRQTKFYWKDADAPAFDAISTNLTSTPGTTFASVSHTNSGSNRLLLAYLFFLNSTHDPTVSSITYDGNTMTLANTSLYTYNTPNVRHLRTYVYYLANPSSGANDFEATFTAVTAYGLAVISYTGVDQTNPIGITNTGNGTGSVAKNVTLLTGTVDSIIVSGGLVRGGDTDPFSQGSGITERWDNATGIDVNTDIGFTGGELSSPTTGTYYYNFTSAANDYWIIVAVEVKPSIDDTTPPTWENIVENTGDPTTYTGSPNYGFQINCTDENGMNNAFFEHNTTGSLANITTSNDTVDIFYANITSMSVGVLNYSFICNDTSGNQNRSDYNTFTVSQATSIITITGISNGTYPQAQTIYWYSDDVDGLTLTGEYNGTSFTNNTDPDLGVGLWNIPSSTSGNENYTSTFTTAWNEITQGISSIDLLLNGTDGDVSYLNESYVNFTVILNVNGNVNLTTNITGWVDQLNKPSPYENISQITCSANNTNYNITGWWNGNVNSTSSTETHSAICYVTITTTTTTTTTTIQKFCSYNKKIIYNNMNVFDKILWLFGKRENYFFDYIQECDSNENIAIKRIDIISNTTSLICNSTYEGSIYYNGNTKKYYGCNSTDWIILGE